MAAQPARRQGYYLALFSASGGWAMPASDLADRGEWKTLKAHFVSIVISPNGLFESPRPLCALKYLITALPLSRSPFLPLPAQHKRPGAPTKSSL